MNRINSLFGKKKQNIFSIYFCAGSPALDTTADVILALQQEGVDLVEIGIPFSDPLADGPVIQDASAQALRNGMSLRRLFVQLSRIRNHVDIPLLLMGYLNPIMQYGFENFCQSCNECGIDGMIIPDLPFNDYMDVYRPVAERHDLRVIMLITPETSEERIHQIDRNTDGFIYMVSSAAVTGAQNDFDEGKQAYFKHIQEMHLRNPCMIGFGISNKQTFTTAAHYAAGCIIGSKFVSLLKEAQGNARLAIRQLKKSLLE